MNDAVIPVLVAVLFVLCLPGTVIAGAGTPPAETSVSAASAVLPEDDADAGNETVRHQNPDEYAADGDRDQLESWLQNRLASQLQDSTIALSEGEYDQARSLVDEEYQDRLEQYVEVAGETDSGTTDGETDAETAYEEAATEQERLADRIQEYRETKAEYEAARDAGDDERARQLARDLEELYAEIDEASGHAVTSYEVIELETGEDLADATETVNRTRDDISQEQTVVREQQFVETDLRLDAEGETASFSDPLVVHGEVRTADGSVLANRAITLDINGRQLTTETAADGTFTVEYRPTELSLSADAVTVQYVPADHSEYLGSETELAISPTQDEPTIENLDATETVAYNDSLQVSGDLTVEGTPVDTVPLEVTIDGEQLGTVSVSDGTFSGSLAVPANVSAGEQTVTVSLPFEERALAGTTADAPVAVSETATELTVNATAVGEDELALEGILETTGGDGLANQPIQVQLGGATAGTLTTDSTGEFAETVAIPSTASDDVTVTATYEGSGTSLTAATTETAVPVPGESSLLDSVPLSVGAALGTVLATVIGVGWWRRRQTGTSHVDDVIDAPSAHAQSAEQSPSRPLIDTLVTRASEQLSHGRSDTAVRSCYMAVRNAYSTANAGTNALTHWEFYRRHASGDTTGGTETESLRELTEAYEQAAFTPDTVSEPVAADALEQTRQLCEESDHSARSPSAEMTERTGE